jgi:thymidylate synthase
MNDFTVISNSEEQRLIERFRQEKQHEEYKYLNLMQNILDNGVNKSDRTGTGTRSLFGTQLKFDLTKSFPLITTKKVFWRGIVEELLWFIRGDTDSKLLEEKGVNIWKGNTSREFLDKRGLDYPEGFAGPIYGFCWRHWGSSYNIRTLLPLEDGNPNPVIVQPGNEGIDQLQQVVDSIKNTPDDRRMIVSGWDVKRLNDMSLPGCHILQQYYVENGHLHLQWYQRSKDVFLGGPFNYASYALLTHLIAKITGLKPGSITVAGGDTHLYSTHFSQAREQISRTPYPFPQLVIKKDIKTLRDIEGMCFEDFELVGYQSHKAIKAEMAV